MNHQLLTAYILSDAAAAGPGAVRRASGGTGGMALERGRGSRCYQLQTIKNGKKLK